MFTESLTIYLCLALFISVSSASMLSPHETHIARDEFYSRLTGEYQSCHQICASYDIHQIFMDQETRPCVWSKYCSLKYKIAFSGCKEGTLFDIALNYCASCVYCSKVFKGTNTPMYSEYVCDFYCKTDNLEELQYYKSVFLEAAKIRRMNLHTSDYWLFWEMVTFFKYWSLPLLLVCAMIKYGIRGTVQLLFWTKVWFNRLFGLSSIISRIVNDSHQVNYMNPDPNNAHGLNIVSIHHGNDVQTVAHNQRTTMQHITDSNNTTEVDNINNIHTLDHITENPTRSPNTSDNTDSRRRSLSASNISDPIQLNDSEDSIDTSSMDSFTSSTDSFSGISLHEDDEDHTQNILSTENTNEHPNENPLVNGLFLDQSCSGVRYRGYDQDRLSPL